MVTGSKLRNGDSGFELNLRDREFKKDKKWRIVVVWSKLYKTEIS